MDKFLTVVTLIFIYVATVFATCKKNCNNTTYNFQVTINAVPDNDSILINDTVWFSIDESTELRDLTTNNIVNFNGATNLSFVFGIWKVISAQSLQPAAGSFTYFFKKGNFVSPVDSTFLREFALVEEINRYKLQVGFIPKQTGIFRILVENSANVSSRNVSCAKANFAIKFVNTNQHFYLGYNIWGEGVYYFKVK